MRSTVRRALCVALALFIAAPSGLALAGKEDRKGVHKPPYKKGPSGGDEWNHIEQNPETGEVAVYRAFPGFSPVVGCAPEPSAGWAMLREKHHVTTKPKIAKAKVDASLDPYGWVTFAVRNAQGDWLAMDKFQGPHEGAVTLKARFFKRPRPGSTITFEFGVQLGDSCPQAGVASASFESVSVN